MTYPGSDLFPGSTTFPGPGLNFPIIRVVCDFAGGAPHAPAPGAPELTAAMALYDVEITRGRQYELGVAETGTAKLDFSDPRELLNPGNPSSPYNSGTNSILPFRPIQITAEWLGQIYTLFTGFVERYPQTWVDPGFRGLRPLEAVDALGMLSNTPLHLSYFDTVMADNPTVWIPYNDPTDPGTVYLATGVSPGPGGVASPGNPSLGTSAYYQQTVSTHGTGLRVVSTSGPGSQVQWAGDHMPDGTPAVSLSSAIQPATQTPPIPPTSQIARLDTAGGTVPVDTHGCTIEWWAKWSSGTVTIAMLEAIVSALGALGYPDTGHGDATIGTSSVNGDLFVGMGPPYGGVSEGFGVGHADDQWHYFALSCIPNADGTTHSLRLVVDTVVQTANPGLTMTNYGMTTVHHHATSRFGDPVSKLAVFGFAYYPTIVGLDRLLAHYRRGIGYFGEQADARITRLLQEHWGGPANIDTGRAVMDSDFTYGVSPVPYPGQVTSPPTTAYVRAALQDVDTAENGFLFVDGAGVVQWRSRTARRLAATTVAELGEQEVRYLDLAYGYDATYVFSQTQLTRSSAGQAIVQANPVTQKIYNNRQLSKTLAVSADWDVVQAGIFYLSRYSAPVLRITKLTLDPASNPLLWPMVLSLELGQRYRIRRRTSSGVVISGDFFLEKLHYKLSARGPACLVELQCSPVPPTAGVCGDLGGRATIGAAAATVAY